MPEASPRQRRKDARPQELLDAALSLFVEKGFAATRSEEVAARAGVSKGTLYLYYPSKEELFKAVIRATLSAAVAAGGKLLDEDGGSCARLLREEMPAWWLRVYDSPACGVFKLVLTEMCNFPDLAAFYTEEVLQPGMAIVARLLQRGISSGEFRAVPLEPTIHSLVMPMVMLCMHKHAFVACGLGHLDPATFMRQHIELVLHGLLPASPAAGPSPRMKG